MLKTINFSWLWVSWVSFTIGVVVIVVFVASVVVGVGVVVVTSVIVSVGVIVTIVVVIGVVVVVTTSFCKLKFLISLMCLLNTRRAFTHWSTSKLIPHLLLLCFNFCVTLIPSLSTFCMNDQAARSIEEPKKNFFKKIIYACHHRKVHGHGSLCNAIAIVVYSIPSNDRHSSIQR